ncbi:MAG: hypothetical protein A2496_23850 [Burkholderiales bacterium RIFOXYC12_FULL_60_6]|nr:MAG: hypothetical protein A2496_23850 [Burkholderiales bacterium RIFOXYC12_FULL_60_6]
MKITPINQPGRILLALRAGRMESSQITETFSFAYSWIFRLIAAGLIERNEDYVVSITPAGRAACPNRRDAQREPMPFKKPAPAQQAMSVGRQGVSA